MSLRWGVRLSIVRRYFGLGGLGEVRLGGAKERTQWYNDWSFFGTYEGEETGVVVRSNALV